MVTEYGYLTILYVLYSSLYSCFALLTKRILEMKKLAVIILCFTSATSFSQLKLGIQAGYNYSQFSDQGNNQQDYHLSGISTFQIGLAIEQSLSKNIFFESGLLFIQKGGHKEPTYFTNNMGSTTTTKINYLQLPLNLAYKTAISKNFKLVIGSGIYVSTGISGSEKGTDNTSGNTTINNKIHFTNSSAYASGSTAIKPFDLGFNINTGIEWQKFQFMANFSRGFGNINPLASSTKFLNQNFGISINYLLPWK